MAKIKLTKVPFAGTPEQDALLTEKLAAIKDLPGALMPAMQAAQEIYGYLPIEVQKIIAEGLGVSLSEVYGVVSFYSQFALNPKGKVAIGVCLGTACYVKGSGAICDKVAELTGIKPGDISKSGIYSFEATRCIGACGLAPVMTVNGDVYGRITAKDVADILAKYDA